MRIYLFDVHREKRKMYRTRKKGYSKKGWAFILSKCHMSLMTNWFIREPSPL